MRRGQTLTEYLLLGILIAIVVIVALTVFGAG
jgi:Flp pilus assembly pilin Flp